MKQKKEHYYKETDFHNTSLKLPYDVEIEKVVLFCILSGQGEDAILEKLDAACFYDPINVKIYKALKVLYETNGSLQKIHSTVLLDMINMTSHELREHFPKMTAVKPENMEYFILILKELKLRRVIISGCKDLIAKAYNDRYNPFDLIEDSSKMASRAKDASVDRARKQDTEDWFVKPDDPKADKYKVLKGKRDGWSDYCIVNNVFVSERDMLSMGYKRVSLPSKKKDTEDCRT